MVCGICHQELGAEQEKKLRLEIAALAEIVEEFETDLFAMQRQRDAARTLVCHLFRKLEMMEQLFGEGPEIVAHNPWMLQEGPWQVPFKEEGLYR